MPTVKCPKCGEEFACEPTALEQKRPPASEDDTWRSMGPGRRVFNIVATLLACAVFGWVAFRLVGRL